MYTLFFKMLLIILRQSTKRANFWKEVQYPLKVVIIVVEIVVIIYIIINNKSIQLERSNQSLKKIVSIRDRVSHEWVMRRLDRLF